MLTSFFLNNSRNFVCAYNLYIETSLQNFSSLQCFLSHVTAMSAKNTTGPGASKQTSVINFLTFLNIFLECPYTAKS